MPVGFSYLRFSRPEQAKGDSRRRQEAFAPEFCKRNNITLNETLRFADEGKSGFKGAHLKSDGALTRFLQHIERGDVKRGDYLIVENVDRLTRQSLYEAEGLLFSILEKGVKIGTQSPPKIYTKKSLNNLSDRIELTIYLARANSESIEKQRRLFEANERKRELAKQGKKTRLALPRWLEFQGDEIVEIPERVKVVQRVFKLSIEGHGLEAIVKQLNQDGVPTFGSARHWARSSVSKLLNARAVLGEYQPFSTVGYDDEAEQLVNVPRRPVGKPIKGYFPQIVSAADFDACARGRRNRQTHHGGRGADKVRNLFTGLIFDARDGSAMHCVDKGD
ncbi:MAG TPA: hypothetical protein DDW52_09050, partial [Planctomycetaceae bacterium]|nr:hypothetical protein [Planctomycetaceae bacterium]